MLRRWLSFVLLVLLVLLAVIGLRTLTIASRQPEAVEVEPIIFEDSLAEKLARALRIRTISAGPHPAEHSPEFTAIHDLLHSLFPLCHTRLKREKVNERSLLFTWAGRDASLPPNLFLAHLDVVPVEEEGSWMHPPFAGTISDGIIWGRGAIDDKHNVIAMLEAVERLLAAGYVPERTLYLAFGHDEEIGGEKGAKRIAEHLSAEGITLNVVLDEGLFIMRNKLPGVSAPVAFIGVAEKGYLDLELVVRSPGGHSSIPPRDPAIALLSRAITRLADLPFPADLRGAAGEMFNWAAPEMSIGYRVLFANRWLFHPFIIRALARDPATNAMIRTTVAPTMLAGSPKANLLPERPSAVVNIRILPGESIAGTIRRVKDTIGDPRVLVTMLGSASEPAPQADTESREFRVLRSTVHALFPEVVTVPALVVGSTDSKHFAGIARHIYRFTALEMTDKQLQGLHGTNEWISIENLKKLTNFYYHLIRRLDRPE